MSDLGHFVLVTSPGFDQADMETAGRLREAGLKIRHEPFDGDRSPAALIRLLNDVVAAIVSTDPFTREVLSQANGLKVIARTGVGTDSIDLEAADEFGISVISTPGQNAITCAEHTIGLMLASVRSIPAHDATLKLGDWRRPGPFLLGELFASHVGVIGFGRIGRAVVERLRPFEVEVMIHDPFLVNETAYEHKALEAILPWADIVTIHAPLTSETHHLIGRREFDLMKSGAVLINASRGGIVDEQALYDALQSGRVGAAALDVFENEPPTNAVLLALPNLIATPHIGGLSRQSMRRMQVACVDGVLERLFGHPAVQESDM